jgi:hypothetical protein
MGLIEWLLTEIAAIILRAFSTLIVDDAKAWIPKVSERIISYSVNNLPANLREAYSNEWRSYVFDTPGELCKLRAACGFFFASWKMARDLRERPASAASIRNTLRGVEELVTKLTTLRETNQRLLQQFPLLRRLIDQSPGEIGKLALEAGLPQAIARIEALCHRRLDYLPRDFEMCRALAARLDALVRQVEASPTPRTVMLARAKIWMINCTFLPRIRASSVDKRKYTAAFNLAVQDVKDVSSRLLLRIAETRTVTSVAR